MFSLIPWTSDLDLTDFYISAAERGFENNSNQQILVDCFQKEIRSRVWILYYKDEAVGSVAAHSLPELGPNAYRICARTCVFTDRLPIATLRARGKTIQQHQNATAQFFIPACIEWCGIDSDMFISTNESPIASQRLVHRIYCPALVETGALTKHCELLYRGHTQTFWKLNAEVFLDQLKQNPWIY
jgi:hypothetical protein